jgi:hypothetical protein
MQNDPSSALTVAPETPPQVVPIAGAKKESIAISERGGLALKTMDEAWRFSAAVLRSGLAPRSFDTQDKIFIAVQMGMELGLPPMSALQNIAVINGRPTLYGDAVPGVCEATGQMEHYKDETFGAIGSDDYGVRVTVRRKGRAEPIVRSFTVAAAKKAGLWGKSGPWTQYPERMLLMRARTFALRDAFPDAMRGLLTHEEARELPEKNVTRSLDDLDKSAAVAVTGAEESE